MAANDSHSDEALLKGLTCLTWTRVPRTSYLYVLGTSTTRNSNDLGIGTL
jgi:hypothetical protein